MNRKHTVDIFEEQYKKWGENAQRLYPNESLIQFIAKNYFHIPYIERKNIKILEIGCGSRANLWMLAKEGFSCYGIDSSATAVKIAKTHLNSKWGVSADVKLGFFEDIPYEEHVFDCIVDIVSLQHNSLEGSFTALNEVNRCLKEGGLFYSYRLSDASTSFFNSGGKFIDAATVDNVSNEQMPLANNGITSFWSPSMVREMYMKSKLEVVSIDRYGRTYDGGLTYIEYLGIHAKKD